MAKDSRVTGTNLEQNGWDNKLKRAAEGDDIFSAFRGDIKGEGCLLYTSPSPRDS